MMYWKCLSTGNSLGSMSYLTIFQSYDWKVHVMSLLVAGRIFFNLYLLHRDNEAKLANGSIRVIILVRLNQLLRFASSESLF